MGKNLEVRIFKLCHTIIDVEHTGIQCVQKTTKYAKIVRVGRSVLGTMEIHIILSLQENQQSLGDGA